MRIQKTDNRTNFQGSGARVLKGIFMTADWAGVASEIRALEPKTGLKVYTLNKSGNISATESLSEREAEQATIWVQDLFNIREKTLQTERTSPPALDAVNRISEKLQEFFGLKQEANNFHIQGGNHITAQDNGVPELLVGEYELKNYSKSELAKHFDAESVVAVPQVAAHIDAFMFVDGKRAFVCDDNIMLHKIADGLNNIEHYIRGNAYSLTEKEERHLLKLYAQLKTIFKKFYHIAKKSPYKKADDAIRVLENAGYETVRIPGRLYEIVIERGFYQHEHSTNFANAILHKNKQGDTVLITNESSNDVLFGIDKDLENKINFSFKKIFIDSVSPYIKKENIHFIEGKNHGVWNLLSNLGGIHRASTEIR